MAEVITFLLIVKKPSLSSKVLKREDLLNKEEEGVIAVNGII
jgi:hypothetical protein